MPANPVCSRCGLAPPEGHAGPCPRCGTAPDLTVGSAPARRPPSTTSLYTPAAAGELVIDDRYEVKAELGRGAFGVVYRAWDRKVGRDVAIKMLNQAALASEEAVRRFQEEAKILCQVNHPNVLSVFDLGEHDGRQYIVLAFIQGRMVKDLIPPGGLRDPVQAARLVAKLAAALHYVYARHRILHRDVKPANMMLAEGDDDALYLMDFGLAVCHAGDVSRQTQDGTVMGTPAYMSKEQAGGKIDEIDHRSDVYAAAAVLFHLLTGRVPFTSAIPWLYVEIATVPAPAPSSIRPGLDPRLDAIVLRGLEKERTDRFQTGKELADALENWVAESRIRLPAADPGYAPVGGRRPAGQSREPQYPGWDLEGPPPAPPAPPPPVAHLPEAPNSGISSVVVGSTLNNARRPPKPRTEPPSEAKRSRPPVVPLPPPVVPVPLPAPEPPRTRRGVGMLLLALVAFALLVGGAAALVLAIRSGQTRAKPTEEDERGWHGWNATP